MKQKREKGKQTTERILGSAAELFAMKSYGAVTVRMIAGKAGIRESSIYNHFTSKDEILNTLYSRYLSVRKGVWKSEDEIEKMIRFMKPAEILKNIFFGIQQEMKGIFLNTVRIILAERYTDQRAADLYYKTMVNEPVVFYELLIKKLIEKELIKPLDPRQFAVEFNFASLAATMEYFMALNGMGDIDTATKKMAGHIGFFCGLLEEH